jgi:peptidoglycan-associated lipoprotein
MNKVKILTTAALTVLVLSSCQKTRDEKINIVEEKSSYKAERKAPQAKSVKFSDNTVVHFAFDSASISSSAKASLMVQAKWLKQNSNQEIRIEGHADERGTREYNLALGERRAAAVRNFLTSEGVSKSNINIISYGEEKPLIAASNPAAWKLNRRAVTIKK